MSLTQETSVMSGRELQEQILHTTDESKKIMLLCETVIRQQQEIFFLRKNFTELLTYFDKMADTVVKLAVGTTAMSNELAPIVKQIKKTEKVVNNDEVNDD